MSEKVTVKPVYLDLAGACSFVALSESTLQQLVREDKFPKPRQLSGRRVGWLVRELEEWAESRPVSEQLPPANTGAKKPKATLNRDRSTPSAMTNGQTILVSAKEAATMLGIGESTLWREVKAKRLPAPIKIGGATRWRVSDMLGVVARSSSVL